VICNQKLITLIATLTETIRFADSWYYNRISPKLQACQHPLPYPLADHIIPQTPAGLLFSRINKHLPMLQPRNAPRLNSRIPLSAAAYASLTCHLRNLLFVILVCLSRVLLLSLAFLHLHPALSICSQPPHSLAVHSLE
jgi:hypothetical protein